MSTHIVKKTIKIHATPTEVWDALTNPEKTKEYYFNCKVHSTWKVGSKITFTGRMFLIIKIELEGEILAVEEAQLLQYSLHNASDNSGTSSTITYKLSYDDHDTTLSISDDVGTGKGAEKRYKKSVKGWDKILSGMKQFIEEE